MLRTLNLIIALLIAVTSMKAQRTCGSAENYHQMMLSDANFAQERQLIEQHNDNYVTNSNTHTRAVVIIPTVFHIVYNNATQNISDAQIQSQLAVLNADFRKLNADASNIPAAFAALAADCEVQFCLAQQTPSGAATNGIVRKSTTVASFSDNDAVKYTAQGGSDIWDRNKYLNIWVCNLGSSLLGYAQFPGGAAATDGVVINYTACGNIGTAQAPFNKGRTATHEIGHWLNLFHIWGDDGSACTGSDNCNDTPNQAAESTGCPTFPATDACAAVNPGKMFMNYMDYTDDACMNMFSAGQKARISALFVAGGARVSLKTSNGCQAPNTVACGNPTGLTTSAITTTGATFNWAAVVGATSYNIQYKASTATVWTTTAATTNSKIITGLTANTLYNFQIQSVCTSGTSAYVAGSNFTTLSTTSSCGNPTGITTSAITTTGATFNWVAVAGATSYNIQYKTSTATVWNTTTATTNSKIITGLTANTIYNFKIQSVCAVGTSAYVTGTNFTTLNTVVSTCVNNYEPNNTFGVATTVGANTNYLSMLATSTDEDIFKITTSATAPKLKVTLSNLPADYDVELYNASGTLLGFSENAGTAIEIIKYNTTVAGTYYIWVYGYNGAYSSSNCYTLNASTGSINWKVNDEEIAGVIKPKINIYPNPATNNLVVNFYQEANKTIVLNVYDLLGQKVITQQLISQAGENKISLNTSHLSEGLYMLEMLSDSKRKLQKFSISK